jgi:hypothetical protein
MPMPREHRKQISILANSLRDFSAFLEDRKFQAALDEFHDKPAARALASKDLVGYLKRKGVMIPDGMKLTLHDNNWEIAVWCGSWYHYDSNSGFGRGR